MGPEIYSKILEEFEQLALSASTPESLMQKIAIRLREDLVRVNWVAFYVVDSKNPRMLRLGPYSGMDIPNQLIPFDSGICGAAASAGKTIVVQRVEDDPRYLPDSEFTRSEIVIPISANSKVVVEIDINSFFESAFDDALREFLERCASLVGRYLERRPCRVAAPE
jgi:GAF domain-containing protein